MAELNLTQLAAKLKQTAGLDNLSELTRLIVLINNKLETKIKTVGAEIKGSFRMAVVAAFPDATDATAMLNLWQSVGGTTPAKNDYLEVSLEDFSKHALYHYDGTKWVKGAERPNHILAGIDLSAYDTTDTLKLIFTQMGTLTELDILLDGGTVTDASKKTLTLPDIKTLVENIKKGTQEEYATFSDDLYYETPEIIEYRDNSIGLTSLDASVATTGNAMKYSTLIKPLDRVSVEGSSFELTMNQNNMEVEYLFITHNKGIRFTGNIGDTYKWETVLRNNVKYIKFTGTSTLKITDEPLSSSAVWTEHAMPHEIAVDDLIDNVNNTAIVQMTFGALPALASKLAHINYVAPLKYYEDRNSSFLKEMLAREAYNYPTNMSEALTYEIYNGKPHVKYAFEGTKGVITHAEIIKDTTSGTTLTFKDLVPVKERIDKVNTSFTLIPAKACSFTYEHPTNTAKKIEIDMAALSSVKFEHISNTQFKVSTDQTLKVDGQIVVPLASGTSESVLNFADYMDANGMMKVFNHYAAGVTINPSDSLASLVFKTYDEFTTRGLLAALQNHIDEADKKFVHKAFEQKPTFTHQAGYIIGSEGDLSTYNIGDQIVIDLSGIDAINTAAGAIGNSDVLFFGTQTSVKQNEAGVEVGLKWKTKTNPTEYNIEDNYLTKDLKVEKKDGYYLLVEWVDKPVQAAEITLNNVSNDDFKKALQRAGVDPTILSHILSNAMGSATPPTTRGDGSPLQAGDWYVDNTGATHIYGTSGFIQQNTPTMDQSSILTLLGLTADQLNNVLKVSKVFTQEEKSKVANLPLNTKEELDRKQVKLNPAQLAHLADELFTTEEKAKLAHLPINVMTEFGKYQTLLTDQQKLAISKLAFTDALKAKYDGYENTKVSTTSHQIGHSSSNSSTFIFRKNGDYAGQSYVYDGGSYVGAFNGASKYALVKMDGTTPKLLGHNGTALTEIKIADIETKINTAAEKTRVDGEFAKRDTKIAANLSKIDALSGGVKTYHYGNKSAADTAKATINFNEGDIAWIGTTGDWIGYHFIGGNWVLNGTTSTHAATLDAYTKTESDAKYATKDLSNVSEKSILDKLPQNIKEPKIGEWVKVKFNSGTVLSHTNDILRLMTFHDIDMYLQEQEYATSGGVEVTINSDFDNVTFESGNIRIYPDNLTSDITVTPLVANGGAPFTITQDAISRVTTTTTSILGTGDMGRYAMHYAIKGIKKWNSSSSKYYVDLTFELTNDAARGFPDWMKKNVALSYSSNQVFNITKGVRQNVIAYNLDTNGNVQVWASSAGANGAPVNITSETLTSNKTLNIEFFRKPSDPKVRLDNGEEVR